MPARDPRLMLYSSEMNHAQGFVRAPLRFGVRTLITLLLASNVSDRHAVAQVAEPSADPPQKQTASIRVSSNMVLVSAAVIDAAGEPVPDLEIEDFRIEEDGMVQSVAALSKPESVPLDLILLYDVSRSAHVRFDFERHVALRFLERILTPKDSVTILSIGPSPHVVYQRGKSIAHAARELAQLRPTELATAFYDSVSMAARLLQTASAKGYRRVQIVLSDGEDNFSAHAELQSVLRELQSADCVLYAVNPSGPSIRLNTVSQMGHDGMHRLAHQTGGAAFLPTDKTELESVFSQIANELRAQYVISYYPQDQRMDGSFRNIAVTIPAMPSHRIRARQGYWPESQLEN